MTITIPVWILWGIAGFIGVIVLAFAVLGVVVMFAWGRRPGSWWW